MQVGTVTTCSNNRLTVSAGRYSSTPFSSIQASYGSKSRANIAVFTGKEHYCSRISVGGAGYDMFTNTESRALYCVRACNSLLSVPI